MKKLIVVIAVVAVVAGGGYFFFSQQQTPTHKVQEFVDATNALDVDKMVDCMDPATQTAFSFAKGVLGGVAGEMGFGSDVDVVDLFVGMAALSMDYQSLSTGEDYSYHISLIDPVEKVEGDTATVDCTMRLDMSAGGSEQTQDCPASIKLQKYDGEWKIDCRDDLAAALGWR